ncbi:hypothetical protein FKG94_03270 [Exilibacterium tricleocarpae]|uniref:Uncharacterized protein n=1 Tax=Exilibacterium tricleocarpae TaxID=2591008 RepID=A0A545U6Z9_9GAMM|nr:hypothetical protein [Exilibacterium tricleocarpae]TQV85224.1 hypothetical protein FKG94_03270 [Exilibacterium tricleocarpae]
MAEISFSDWQKKLVFVAQQTKQAMDKNRPFVRCGCQKKLWMQNAYKCLYCGEWYCKECAEIHFGKTVAEYRAQHPVAVLTET